MNWNDKQKEAIDFRNDNLLVAAAAGSGKTAVLAERVTRIILNGEADIDEMLIVTFTKAAAMGMKEKIAASIRARLADDFENGRTESSARLKHQLELLSEASISTYDAFAQKVVRDNFQAVDIDPGVKVADDSQTKILSAAALDELIEKRLAAGEPDFIEFLDTYASVKSLEGLKEMIKDFYQGISALDDPFGFMEKASENLSLDMEGFATGRMGKALADSIFHAASKAMRSLELAENLADESGSEKLKTRLLTETTVYRAIYEAARGLKEKTEKGEIANPEDYLAEVDGIITLYDSLPAKLTLAPTKSEPQAEKDAFEAVKDELDAAKTSYRDGFKKKLKDKYLYQPLEDSVREINATAKTAKIFCDLTREYHEIFMAMKLEKGVLDFGDFMHLALQALSCEDIAEQYRTKFKYIFVDEYQDSNELQDALIARLSTGDNVFMVGDVKQSIYRFRQAEPKLFTGRYERYKYKKDGGKVIDLNYNYRSKSTVIDITNEVFRKVMEGYDDDAALNLGCDYDGKLLYDPEICLTMPGGEYTKDEIEAFTVAKIIKEKMASGMLLPERNGNGYTERPIRYSDIVILRSAIKGTSDTYTRIFRELGIPFASEQSDGYFESTEIEIFVNLLSVIDNLRQDVPLISVLYSPIFGFSAEQLACIRTEAGDRSMSFSAAFLAVCEKESELGRKCKAALDNIREYRDAASLMELSDFVWMLLQKTGFYIYAGSLPGGRQRQINLDLLVQKAGEFSKSGSGIYGFLRRIDAIKNRKIPVAPAATVGEGADAVRLMTIHKSKGLEFPVVILAGMHKQIKGRDNPSKLPFSKELECLGFSLINRKEGWKKKTLAGILTEDMASREEICERERLLYVAFTRAIDSLLMVGCIKDYETEKEAWKAMRPMNPEKAMAATTYLDMVMPVAYSMKNCSINVEEAAAVVPQDLADDGEEQAGGVEVFKKAKVRPEIEKRLSYSYPYMEEASKKSKYSVTELGHGEADKKVFLEDPDILTSTGFFERSQDLEEDAAYTLTAAEKGTLYHLVMENLDFTADAGPDPDATLEMLKAKGSLEEKEAAALDTGKIREFCKSSLAARMKAAAAGGKLHREVPFTLRTDWQGSKICVQGIIDCWFSEKTEDGSEKFVLIDYKTSKIRSREDFEKLKERYATQMEIYGRAVTRLCGGETLEKYLVFLDAGEAVEC